MAITDHVNSRARGNREPIPCCSVGLQRACEPTASPVIAPITAEGKKTCLRVLEKRFQSRPGKDAILAFAHGFAPPVKSLPE